MLWAMDSENAIRFKAVAKTNKQKLQMWFKTSRWCYFTSDESVFVLNYTNRGEIELWGLRFQASMNSKDLLHYVPRLPRLQASGALQSRGLAVTIDCFRYLFPGECSDSVNFVLLCPRDMMHFSPSCFTCYRGFFKILSFHCMGAWCFHRDISIPLQLRSWLYFF